MNNSLIKYKDLALKVIYYTKKRHLGQAIFFATSKFQEVLAYFEKNLKDSQTFLKSCYFLNGRQIYPSDILLYFCTVDPNLRLVEEDMFLEIEELEHLDDASEPIYEKLIKPLINPFKLIFMNIKEGILQMIDFPKDKISELELDTLNNNYACCNSTDSLYISQGKNFWIIPHDNFEIEKKEMPFFKEKHSMTYILSNNTIFIAGGSEESFYYDINTKEFIEWGKMKGAQEQPALIQYGDFLYSFNSFNQNGIYFEKTKLTNPAKKWEKMIPQSGDQESGFFYNKLFGVSKCSGGNILFAGGVNNQLRTFIYNLKLNVLYINPSKDESIILNERTFYKIDHNFNIAIPKNIEKDHIIAIANKNSKTLNLVPFEHIGIKTRNSLLCLDNPRNRIPGHVVIQCRYMSLKDYESFLKHKEMQLNNKTKGGFDIYNRKEQGKKLGDKLNPDPYKYQYRGKTPLALERISEGKSDEENEDDNTGKKRTSSAKKQKRALELGLKIENVGKYNFITEKREEKEEEEDVESNNNKNDFDEKNIKQKKEVISKKEEVILIQNNKNTNSSSNLTKKKGKCKTEIFVNNEDNEHNYHSDLEPEEIFNNQNTHTEIKQKMIIKNSNSNIKEIENDGKNGNELITNDKNQEIKKIYNSKTDIELNKNKINKNLNIYLNKKEKGKNKESNNTSQLSSITDNNNMTKNYYNTQFDNRNINININMNDIFKLKNDTKDLDNNRVNNNININLNNNFNKINISTNDNEENNKIEKRKKMTNSNSNSKGNIYQGNQMQNRNISSSANNINNINHEYQKKINKMNNNSNIIQNLKNKENSAVIHKSNTDFISSMISQKTQQKLNNSNPFIDNSKYHNIEEKESFHLKEEKEPNINKIMTNKNTKTINEIKKSQKRTNYKTNTVTSIPINTENILSGLNSNYNTNQNNQNNIKEINDKNVYLTNNNKMSSYKASTHKQSKGNVAITLNNNQNAYTKNNKIIISGNNGENLNYSAIPINKKIFKNNISPQQKRVNSQKSHNIQTEGNLRKERYIKNRQNFETQRSNNTINIINNRGNNISNNSVRLMKIDIGLNEQIMKGSKNAIVIKDGKRYVLAKNVQRIRREEENGKFSKIEERKKIYYSTNFTDGNQ